MKDAVKKVLPLLYLIEPIISNSSVVITTMYTRIRTGIQTIVSYVQLYRIHCRTGYDRTVLLGKCASDSENH